MNTYQQNGRNQAARDKEKVPLHSLKETSRGSLQNPLSPRARGYVRVRCGTSRYKLAGGAAAEIIQILGAARTLYNYRLWAYYCYHHDVEIILEKAYEIASKHRQGEIKWPVRAFQKWLKVSFGKDQGGVE